MKRTPKKKTPKTFYDFVGPFKIKIPKFAPARRSAMSYPVYYPMDSSVLPDVSSGGGMISSLGDGGGAVGMGESVENIAISNNKTTYEYSALMLEVVEHPLFSAWSNRVIHSEDLYIDPSIGIDGYNDDYHITLLCGIYDELPTRIFEYVKDLNRFDVKGCSIEVFKNLKYDVVVLKICNDGELKNIHDVVNSEIKTAAVYKKFNSDYIPHITLAYVKKGTCDHLVGSDFFTDMDINATSITFSSKNGKNYNFTL